MPPAAQDPIYLGSYPAYMREMLGDRLPEFTDEERAGLKALAHAAPGSPDAVRGTAEFMKARARELYDYLVELVRSGGTRPVNREGKGGIVLAGWSFGSAWMVAFLANVASFGANDVDLSAYVRRVIFYGQSRLSKLDLLASPVRFMGLSDEYVYVY